MKPLAPTSVVSVGVCSTTRRVDLVLPAWVPVADLVPELARGLGLLDRATAHQPLHLVTTSGLPLADDLGLAAQGVRDGHLLTVVREVDAPPDVHDDIAEALAVVAGEVPAWDPASARRSALAAATLLTALGAVALAALAPSVVTGFAILVTAALLVVGAAVTSRLRRDVTAAVLAGCLGSCVAALGAFVLAATWGVAFPGAAASAGAGAAVAGMVAMIGLDEGRSLLVAPVILGTLGAVVGLAVVGTRAHPSLVATVVMSIVVLASATAPGLCLAVAGVKASPIDLHEPSDEPDHEDEDAAVDLARLTADATAAHHLLVALTATIGLLPGLAAPLAVGLGIDGALIAFVAALLVVLRSRRHRSQRVVQVALATGILSLATVAASALALHPDWRAVVACALIVAGGALFGLAPWLGRPSVRRNRVADLLESGCVVTVPPLLVLAAGLPTRLPS